MKEYWYLREGDFRPEPIESICKSWHRSRRSIVEFLSQNGNIFKSKEAAEEASHVVRAALKEHSNLNVGQSSEKDYSKLFEKLVLAYAHNPEKNVCTNAAYYAYSMFHAITGVDYEEYLLRQKQNKQQV